MSLKPVDAPDLLATFFSVSAVMDRLSALPVEVVEIVEDRPSGRPSTWVAWTPKEEERLWMLWEIGTSRAEMARITGRTRHAIDMRLKLMLGERVG